MKRILLVGMLFSAAAGAQVFDPDPEDPRSKRLAEARAIGSMLGMMPPPVGWVCTMGIPDPTTWTLVECHPDPALIEQQEEERRRWYEEFRKRAERIGRRR